MTVASTGERTPTTRLIPVHTSLAVIEVLTPEQRRRVEGLAAVYRANSIALWRDDYATESVLFSLYSTADVSREGLIVNGLIEPDGRSHT